MSFRSRADPLLLQLRHEPGDCFEVAIPLQDSQLEADRGGRDDEVLH